MAVEPFGNYFYTTNTTTSHTVYNCSISGNTCSTQTPPSSSFNDIPSLAFYINSSAQTYAYVTSYNPSNPVYVCPVTNNTLSTACTTQTSSFFSGTVGIALLNQNTSPVTTSVYFTNTNGTSTVAKCTLATNGSSFSNCADSGAGTTTFNAPYGIAILAIPTA